jgi:hypothetical protein
MRTERFVCRVPTHIMEHVSAQSDTSHKEAHRKIKRLHLAVSCITVVITNIKAYTRRHSHLHRNSKLVSIAQSWERSMLLVSIGLRRQVHTGQVGLTVNLYASIPEVCSDRTSGYLSSATPGCTEWMKNWKGFEKMRPWPDGICLEGLRKSTKVSVMIVGAADKIQTEQRPNTSREGSG